MWRWAAASTIGTSHIRTETRLQDAYTVSALDKDHICAIVSDGAGSAKFGANGAWLTCRTLKVRFREWFAVNDNLPNDETIADWIDDLRDLISVVAKRRASAPRQFAATLAALIASPDEILTLQIGDSAIVARSASKWEVMCWPENGEYASTTYFVTDNPEPQLTITRQKNRFDAFSLFSDGVGDLALSHLEQTAYSRFFDPMIKPVDASTSGGRLSDLSGKLATYLSSSTICERTDDDKTLILLSKT